MNRLKELLEIANIHKKRIELALENLAGKFPFTAKSIEELSDFEILNLELLTNRFAKLQDYLGNKVINEFLKLKGEYTDSESMVDKVNKLERLEVLQSSNTWKEIREIRNHISHEYPDHPELTAYYVNQMHELVPQLLEILTKINKEVH